MEAPMTTFVLVHGAWHGAWCWDRLVPELSRLGCSAVAVDLPCDDPTASFDDYARVVADAAAREEGRVVIVGHSLGAYAATIAALQQPVDGVVYLCGVLPEVAGMPKEGEPAQFEEGTFDGLVRHPDGSHNWPDEESAIAAMYHDCPVDDGRAAYARLRRQQTWMWDGLQPLPAWPDTTIHSVLCREDRMVSPAWSRWVASNWLGVTAVEMDGGHSPMLSRPDELAALLDRMAAS
jgi:pimeloyl-ACP methyl ester carboxylesterase